MTTVACPAVQGNNGRRKYTCPVSFRIDQEGDTLEELEAKIGGALQQAGRELLREARQHVEAQVLDAPKTLRRS
ncbi:MAG: hypothetical protein P1P76_04480 [Anaerolineales bacterium]|nr:hypothetical protein [Anaerolineales bacterium]